MFLILSVFCIENVKSDCVMYDICNKKGTLAQNCPYDGPPKPLNDTDAIEILKRMCGDFFTDGTVFISTLEFSLSKREFFGDKLSFLTCFKFNLR